MPRHPSSKRCALLVLLIAVPASANSVTGGPVSRGDILKSRQYQNNSTLSLFVDTTGNDGNSCTSSGTGACLTIAGAVSKLAARQNGVCATITVGAGTFAGAQIAGFTVLPSSSGGNGCIYLKGTFANYAPATGTATGTLTAFSASSGATFAVFTDSGQTWTVNDLRGQMLFLTGGTGASNASAFPIVSNTATAITVAGVVTGFNTTTTYAIRTWSTTISTVVPAEGTTQFGIANNFTSAGLRLASNNSDGSSGTGVVVEGFLFALSASTRAIVLDQEAKALIRWNKFSTNVAVGIETPRTASARIDGNYFTGVTNGLLLGSTSSSGQGSSITGNYFSTGTNAVVLAGPVGSVNNNFFSAQTTASITATTNSLAAGQVTGNRIDGSGTGIRVVDSTSTGGTTVAIGLNFADISNCTVAAINLTGPKLSTFTNAVTGTGNLVALIIGRGAHAQVSANSTLTGTTEVQLDGTNYTFAQMRALTPKSICDLAYGTCFFE